MDLDPTPHPPPQAVVFKNFTVGGVRMGFTVQPANAQHGQAYDARNGGTQYIVSSASYYRTNVSSIVSWAIVNTSLITQACAARAVRRWG